MGKVKIGDVAQFCRGVSYKKEQARKTKADGFVAILRANNIEANRLIFDDLVYVPSTLIQENQYISNGDIIITMSSGSKAHVGKVAVALQGLNCSFGAFCGKIVPKDIVPKYLCYILQGNLFRRHIERQCKGTNINNIRQSYILDYEIDLPPIAEQEHIVARIEELLSQLDANVSELKTAKERLKVYRQAVLKEAFGNLEGNTERTIMSVCTNIVDCPHSTPKWTKSGKLCLRTTNFKPGYLDLSEKNYVSEETFNERIDRLRPQSGDVLFSREGAILGIACIIPDGLEICMGQRMMLLRPQEGLMNKYLMHYLNSPKARTLITENIGGTASPHINVGDIKQFTIPVVPLVQQQSVVAEIESRLSVCESIEKTVDTALQQAEALRQSILKKAFEGGFCSE